VLPVQKSVELLRLGFDPLTETQTVDAVLAKLRGGRGGWIATVNVDILRQYLRDREIRRAVDDADIVVADGMPLVWASRVAGTPLPERVAGSSLIWTLTQAAGAADASVYLLGGTPAGVEDTARALSDHVPDLRVAGTWSPPFGHEDDEEELRRIDQQVTEAKPDIVFIGIEFAKARRLAERLLVHNPHTWFICCGISFSFVTGEVRRAPAWMQRIGAEWLHRLAQEPRRLFRRYMVDGLPVVAHLFGDAVRRRLSI
jgi:N-acetylglucosaminyldiphosphoundecaprenol N-acetyl-beta-D-mannosaminyltransferase